MSRYECDRCGACCRTFPIFASEADARDEPRIATDSCRLPDHHVDERWTYRLFPLPFLTGCPFLQSDATCEIYSSRPQVCRSFAAGSPSCQEARSRLGLGFLAPNDYISEELQQEHRESESRAPE
jgi:Fe-S-cluster containining protein